MTVSRRTALASLITASFAGPLQAAENFPSRPLRLVVPLGPGSGFDAAARLFADGLSKEIGQPVVVINKPGADTVIGVMDVLQSPADGYTILALTGSTVAITPFLGKDTPFDPKEIRAFSGMIRSSACFVVPEPSIFRTLPQLVGVLRAKPNSVSLGHYAQIYRHSTKHFENLAKVQFNQVSYNSPSQTTADLLSGTLDVAILETSAAIPLIRSGRLRALAIASANRVSALPDTPTVSEVGWQGFKITPWTGFAVSAKTPNDVFQKLESAALNVVRAPSTTKWIVDRLSDPMPMTSEEMRKLIDDDIATLAPIVKEARPR